MTSSELQGAVNQLKNLIPFDDFAIARIIVLGGELHSVDACEWFAQFAGFQDFYMDRKVFNIDPVIQECLDRIRLNDFSVQFWGDTYGKRPSDEFFKICNSFGLLENIKGYSVIYRVNMAMYVCFSITGVELSEKKSIKICNILAALMPAIAMIPGRAKIGKIALLTDKQFEVYQMLKTAMTYEQIAKALGVTTNSISRHFALIQKKLGIGSRSKLYLGKTK